MTETARWFQMSRTRGNGWLQAVNGYFSLGLVWVFLVILALPTPAAEDDATLLQQQAIACIEAAVEHFRKTGDSRSRIADLQQAENELTTSNQAFAARGDWSAVAHGLVWLGQIQRMQANGKPAW